MSEVNDLAGAQAQTDLHPDMEPVRKLPPPVVLETGTILTLRKPGHLRSPIPGQEYFAPAIVLLQYDSDGSIDALVFDASAGAHFVSAYQIREIDARTDNFNRREMFVKRSNIGEILFSPAAFKSVEDGMDTIALAHSRIRQALAEQNTSIESLHHSIASMQQIMHQLLDRLAAVELITKQFEPQSTSLSGSLSGQQAAADPGAATREVPAETPKGGSKGKS